MSDDADTGPGRGTVVKGRGRHTPARPVRSGVRVGAKIGGKYTLRDELGSGGMGAVYRAVQEPLGREVAVKLIHARAGRRMSQRQRFFQEARVIAGLSHSSTVRLFDYGEDANGLYMVLELIRGQSLREVLRAEKRLGAVRVARIAQQVLGALAEAHALGVVHRDLKPDNMMLVAERLAGERVKVLDFGVAKIVRGATDVEGIAPGGDENGDAIQTFDGVVVGSPQYMAPEQGRPGESEPRTDLYALGVVMYELLTGRPPYDRSTALDLIDAHTEAPIPELPPGLGVPAALAGVVRRALAKHPDDRYADAEAMAEAIQGAVPEVLLRAGASAPVAPMVDLDDEPTMTLEVEPPEHARTRRVKRPTRPPPGEGTSVIPISDIAPRVGRVERAPFAVPAPIVELPAPEVRPSRRGWVWAAVVAGAGLVLAVVLLQHPPDAVAPSPPPPEPAARALAPVVDASVAAPVDAEVVEIFALDFGIDAEVELEADAETRDAPRKRRKRRRRRPRPPKDGLHIPKL